MVDTIPGSGRLWFTWNSSVDQDAGEHDVLQYILYRKPQGATTWSDPLIIVRRTSGQASYTLEISGNTVAHALHVRDFCPGLHAVGIDDHDLERHSQSLTDPRRTCGNRY